MIQEHRNEDLRLQNDDSDSESELSTYIAAISTDCGTSQLLLLRQLASVRAGKGQGRVAGVPDVALLETAMQQGHVDGLEGEVGEVVGEAAGH